MMNNIKEKFYFGEIVLLKFPFTDGISYKRRPALVLLDTNDEDVVVCRITSKIYSTDFDFIIENSIECGLKLLSVIRLHKIASLEKNLIEEVLGKINKKLEKKVKQKFLSFLE